MTQHERIIKHMRLFGYITPMQAFNYLGITKLSTRIGELIREGYDIEKEKVTSHNRYGEKCHFMRYTLKED